MSRREYLLKWWLRLLALTLFCALPAVLMPFSWMALIHRELGLGQFPETPVISYLARSVSLLYASYGAISWYCSLDVRRWREMIRFQGWLSVVFGGLMLAADLLASMPLVWVLCEAALVEGIGAVTLILSRRPQAAAKSCQSAQANQSV
jgi:hypothetical protein